SGVLELLDDVMREGAWMGASGDAGVTAVRLARHYAEYHLERRLRAAAAADVILLPGPTPV
ncbi:MAG: hypothetical protein ACRDKW_02440, partial [Actinomycetota bacterium]